jgi:hypothetical protein
LEVNWSVPQSWAMASLALQELYQYKLVPEHFFDAWLEQSETHFPAEQVWLVKQLPQLMVLPQPSLHEPHW